jgi:hypothetical protein
MVLTGNVIYKKVLKLSVKREKLRFYSILAVFALKKRIVKVFCHVVKVVCHHVKPFCHVVKVVCHHVKPFCHGVKVVCHHVKPFCHGVKPFCHCVKVVCHGVKPFCHCVKVVCHHVKPFCHCVRVVCHDVIFKKQIVISRKRNAAVQNFIVNYFNLDASILKWDTTSLICNLKRITSIAALVILFGKILITKLCLLLKLNISQGEL